MLRRYLTHLPEPVIPLEFYQQFLEPLLPDGVRAAGHVEGATVGRYGYLIKQLPLANQHLLLYLLDLLAVFVSHADETRMTSANLAAVFHPEILSRPEELLDIQKHKQSQDVLQYLVEHSDSFTPSQS